jgi:hypothetical protein
MTSDAWWLGAPLTLRRTWLGKMKGRGHPTGVAALRSLTHWLRGFVTNSAEP